MDGIIDIHNHILFDVDDGSKNFEQSLTMLKEEYSQGVRKVIVTPHYQQQIYENKPEEIEEKFIKLKKAVSDNIPQMEIFLGNEIMACNDIVQLLENKCLYTMAGSRYVLIEFYPNTDYNSMEKEISNILNAGYNPIIAHSERYKCFRKRIKTINFDGIKHLIEMGAYIQVNCTSVYDHNRKFVRKLMENDLLHFVASDAHNMTSRGINWKQSLRNLENRYDEKYLEWLLIDNPEKVIQDEYI